MTATVHRLQLIQCGDQVRLDAEAVLDGAKGRDWDRLMVIGQVVGEDRVYVAGNANAGETLILMELAKLQIINARPED